MVPSVEEILYCQRCPVIVEALPERFTLLCWNLNKVADSRQLKRELDRRDPLPPFDLMLFQEARLDTVESLLRDTYEIHAGINLRIGNRRYGVLSASKVRALEACGGHSRGREALFGPPKAYLTTRYALPGGRTLLCLNLHAINFRETRHYRRELEQLYTLIHRHRGPMIVAGDFNRWNRGRASALADFTEELRLIQLDLRDKPVKSFLGHPLDFVFYRNLSPLRSDVHSQHLSDHNPICAEFTLC